MTSVCRSFSLILLSLILMLFLFSCASPPQEAPEEPSGSEPAAETSPEEPEEKVEPSAEDQEQEDESFSLDKEEKERTKRDLNELVDKLNMIIANEEYEKWLDYLTEDYKDYYSDPQHLKELSDSPTLSKYDIELRSLRDYFRYVVVASRKDVHISDIKAIGKDTVKAYMDVNGQSVVVYTLKKTDDRWKITISK